MSMKIFGVPVNFVTFGVLLVASQRYLKGLIPKKYHDYDEIIDRHAKLHGLDPALIKAHIMQESSFNPNAKRDEGRGRTSGGLMQLLYPTTVNALVRKYGLAPVTLEDLYDPEVNINLGTVYMKELKDRYPDNLAFRIVSYNSGRPKYKADKVTFINEHYFDRVHGFFLTFTFANIFGL